MGGSEDGRVKGFAGFGVMADPGDVDPTADRWTCSAWHTDFPGWDLKVTVNRTPRGPEIVELTIVASDEEDPPVGGLQTRLLRAISLHAIYELAHGVSDLFVEDGAVNAWTATTRPGRAGRSDYEYAQWAARYVEALSSTRPVAEMAERWNLSDSQIRNIIHACRQRELLTKSAPGRAGGELTDRAKQALQRGSE